MAYTFEQDLRRVLTIHEIGKKTGVSEELLANHMRDAMDSAIRMMQKHDRFSEDKAVADILRELLVVVQNSKEGK